MALRARTAVTVSVIVLAVAVTGCVSGLNAGDRALDAEEAYLSEQFENASCVESWATSSPIAEAESSIVNRTGDGAYVAVKHPYSYGTTSEEVDHRSEAVYRVTDENERRVGGGEVAPC